MQFINKGLNMNCFFNNFITTITLNKLRILYYKHYIVGLQKLPLIDINNLSE
jgi:hypothetical protein